MFPKPCSRFVISAFFVVNFGIRDQSAAPPAMCRISSGLGMIRADEPFALLSPRRVIRFGSERADSAPPQRDRMRHQDVTNPTEQTCFHREPWGVVGTNEVKWRLDVHNTNYVNRVV